MMHGVKERRVKSFVLSQGEYLPHQVAQPVSLLNMYIHISFSFKCELVLIVHFSCAVAERIASERGENIGDSVGYKVLLNKSSWFRT